VGQLGSILGGGIVWLGSVSTTGGFQMALDALLRYERGGLQRESYIETTSVTTDVNSEIPAHLSPLSALMLPPTSRKLMKLSKFPDAMMERFVFELGRKSVGRISALTRRDHDHGERQAFGMRHGDCFSDYGPCDKRSDRSQGTILAGDPRIKLHQCVILVGVHGQLAAVPMNRSRIVPSNACHLCRDGAE
jgi:hypothetical protein